MYSVPIAIGRREVNKEHSDKGLNIRDFASINELVVLSNLENVNAILIERKENKEDRFIQLRKIAKSQLATLDNKDFIKSIKKLSETTYLDAGKKI
ncbi:hypothetical protein [Aquiflexum lacus]|nr:hypothetical protein [Aquiflexum lacus]